MKVAFFDCNIVMSLPLFFFVLLLLLVVDDDVDDSAKGLGRRHQKANASFFLLQLKEVQFCVFRSFFVLKLLLKKNVSKPIRTLGSEFFLLVKFLHAFCIFSSENFGIHYCTRVTSEDVRTQKRTLVIYGLWGLIPSVGVFFWSTTESMSHQL